jgi:hypothetical protein
MGREEMEEKILKDPSPLPSPAEWRGEQKDEKILTSPHPTLSRRVERGEGREEMKEIPTMWREKNFRVNHG